MNSFVDDTNEQWDLDIDYDRQELLHARHKINILDLDFDKLQALMEAPGEFTKCMGTLCEAQRTARNVDINTFRSRLRGDGLLRAFDAFVKEVSLFFLTPQRAALLKSWSAIQRAMEIESEATQAAIATMPETETLAREILAQMKRHERPSDESSGASVENSEESIRADTATANS